MACMAVGIVLVVGNGGYHHKHRGITAAVSYVMLYPSFKRSVINAKQAALCQRHKGAAHGEKQHKHDVA